MEKDPAYYEIEFHKWENSEIGNNSNFYSKKAFVEASIIERNRILSLIENWQNSEDISIKDVVRSITNPELGTPNQ